MNRHRRASAEQLAHAAVHEAMHALAVVALGGRLTACTITDRHVDDGRTGETSWYPGSLTPGGEREAAWAGAVGEAVWLHGPFVSVAEVDAVLADAGRFDLDLVAAADPFGRRVTEPGPHALRAALVAMLPHAQSLAGRLVEHGAIVHREVCHVLGVPMLGPPLVTSLRSVTAGDTLAMRCASPRPLPPYVPRRSDPAA